MFKSLGMSGLAYALTAALLAAPVLTAAQSPAVDAARAAVEDYDRDGARAILTEACDGGDAAACHSLLGLLDQSYSDEDERAARALAVRLCNSDDLLGCVTLMRYAGDGDGGDIDQPLQRDAAIKSCRAGVASGCYQAGQMASQGDGGAQDLALASEFYELACSGEDAAGCQLYANALLERGWDTNDEAEQASHWGAARDTYRRACNMGDTYSCTALAELLIEGRGGDEDRAGGMALLEQACRSDRYQCRQWLKYHAP